MTATVRVLPSGTEVLVEGGETILEAALRQRVKWPTRCLGKAACRLCYFSTADNSVALNPLSDIEERALKGLFEDPGPGRVVRLACQTRPVADIEVFKVGVHPPPASGRSNAQDLEETR